MDLSIIGFKHCWGMRSVTYPGDASVAGAAREQPERSSGLVSDQEKKGMATGAAIGLGTMLAVFGGGLLSFFSPCVAPLIPGYLGYLSSSSLSRSSVSPAEQSGQLGTKAIIPCLLFVSGFSLAFIALGVISASAGRLVAAYTPVLETIAGIVMVVMGAFLLNFLPEPVMKFLARERRLYFSSPRLSRIGVLGPVALGVVFAAGWTPCIGPVLGPILLAVGTTGQVGSGFVLLLIYSIGFGLPFLAIGLGWSFSLRLLRWLRRHGQLVTTVTGLFLIAFGILYLTGWVTIFADWAQVRL
jgi:cytochrome c-type biogenesis protein